MHANWSTSAAKPGAAPWPEQEAVATPVLVVPSPARTSVPAKKAPAPPRPKPVPRTAPRQAEQPGGPVEPETTPRERARRIQVIEAVLRLAASTESAISAALPALTEFAARCGVRLDGTHVSGVAASLPNGGTTR